MTSVELRPAPRMTVLIVDDEALCCQRLRQLLEPEPDVTIVGECARGLEALNTIPRVRPELVFLDVRMPDLSGVGVVEALDGVLDAAAAPEVVFVTAYDEYMERAFELHALDYLKKPFTDARFASALARARRLVAARRAVAASGANGPVDEALVGLLTERQRALAAAARQGAECTVRRLPVRARSGARWTLVDPDTIAAVEADAGVAVRLHVGADAHPWDQTMADAERGMARFGFVRVHRRWLVNPAHVAGVVSRQRGDYTLMLRDGAEVPTGRSYRDVVERAFGLNDR